MTSMPLFDLLLARERNGQGSPARTSAASVTAEWAEQSVRQLLDEYERIHTIDLRAGRDRGENGVFDRELAMALESAYEDWGYKVEALLKRVDRLAHRGAAIAGADSLRGHYGRTKAMLSVTLDELDAAKAEADRGEVISGEDLRRELQLRAKH
jgi:hypothetical protein